MKWVKRFLPKIFKSIDSDLVIQKAKHKVQIKNGRFNKYCNFWQARCICQVFLRSWRLWWPAAMKNAQDECYARTKTLLLTLTHFRISLAPKTGTKAKNSAVKGAKGAHKQWSSERKIPARVCRVKWSKILHFGIIRMHNVVIIYRGVPV